MAVALADHFLSDEGQSLKILLSAMFFQKYSSFVLHF